MSVEFNKIRKSLLMAWEVCPRQAWYNIRDPRYNEYNTFNFDKKSLLLGQVFHKEMDSFYSKIDVNEVAGVVKENSQQELDDVVALVAEKFFNKFSKTKNRECLRYFRWYAEIEARRFIELYVNSKTGLAHRFLPLYIEKYVEWDNKDVGVVMNGQFYRLDAIDDKHLRLVEYKTGLSYDPAKNYKLTKLRLELYWYKEIIEHMEEFKGKTVSHWMLINPTIEKVFESKFSNLTKSALYKKLPMVLEDINKETPAERKLNFYCDSCRYKNECLIEPKKNLFKEEWM